MRSFSIKRSDEKDKSYRRKAFKFMSVKTENGQVFLTKYEKIFLHMIEIEKCMSILEF